MRRNLYLCSPESYSRELIANRLLAPSYVSYETVLSACGIIPERVYAVRSSCLARSRSFDNATGHYEYICVPGAYYPEGVTINRTPDGLAYLAARPEKAICDLILATSRLRLPRTCCPSCATLNNWSSGVRITSSRSLEC